MIFGLDPPPPPLPPKPPFRCPHQDKKGINLLLFQLGIHLHTHQDLKLKCSRVMGQKLRCGRPCTRDLPSTQKWLAQSHIASISSLTISCWHNPVNLEWFAAPLAWLAPRPASRLRILRSLGRCCLGKVDLLMAGSAAEMLLVSFSCPLPLLRTRPPSLLVCCFFVFVEMGATSTASGRLEVKL